MSTSESAMVGNCIFCMLPVFMASLNDSTITDSRSPHVADTKQQLATATYSTHNGQQQYYCNGQWQITH